MSMRTLTIDADAISLKLADALGILDLIYTLDGTGDLESLNKGSLVTSLGEAMDRIGEACELLAGTSQGEAA